MKVVSSCILFVMYFQFSLAQNLVPDSSFEMNKFVPMEFSLLGASSTWSIPSRGTSDLFCKCDRKTKLFSEKIYSEVDVPQNPMGYQNPHSGTCYAGLFAYSHGNYREYLQVQLTTPLEKNKTYLFTMYVSLADYSRASIDQFGVCFSSNKVTYNSSNEITNLKPVYINVEAEVGNDVKHWHQLTVNYKAKGGEVYLVLGSFKINKIKKTKVKAPKEAKSRINQHAERDAYYFIDDVSLVKIFSKDTVDVVESVIPNDTIVKQTDTSCVLKNVLFQSNKTTLLPSSCSELDSLSIYLTKNANVQIEIYGHTDNTGKETKNKKLSYGRAKAVAEYLITNGIDKKRIKFNGYGSSKPIATNETEEGKQLNRRVEFYLRRT
jgi:OmpA-OmpF porin, OOP family